MSFPPDWQTQYPAGDTALEEAPPDQFETEEEPEPVASQEVDYNIDWPEEKRQRLGRRITSQIRAYIDATHPRRENLKTWRRAWDLMPEGPAEEDDSGPFAGSADLTTADTRRSCNAHHSRLNEQILLLDPPFAVIAKDDQAVAAVPQIEEALPALLEEAEWQIHGDDLHRELPVAGNAFLRVTYETQTRQKPIFEGDLDEQMAQARVQAGQDFITAGFDSLKRDEQGRVIRKLGFEDVIERHGIVFKVVPWEDGIILPITAQDAEKAYGIGERLMVTGEELWAGAQSGKYLKEEVEALLNLPPDGLDDDLMESLELQGINPPVEGVDSDVRTEDNVLEVALYHTYLCWEMCYLLDTKGNGKRQWCWILIHPATQRILRLAYLPWGHGRPHYHHFRYLKRSGRLWAQGIAEMIASFQDSRSAIFQQWINWHELAVRIATMLVCDESSGLDPDEFELVLGKIIKVDSINGIKQLVLPPMSDEHLKVAEMLKAEIDLLTGASDPAMGKEAAGQHTLGEIQIAQSNGNLHFQNTAASVARQWARVWDDCRHLIAQYGEGEDIPYRRAALPGARIQIDESGNAQPGGMMPTPNPLNPAMPGMGATDPAMAGQQPPPTALPLMQGVPPQEPFGTITSDMLRQRVDLVPAGLAHMSDIQSRIQQAQITYNTVMALPIVQANPRLVILVLDYYLQQLRVPIRQQLIQALEETYLAMAGAQAAVAQQNAQAQQQAGANALGAQAAGQEGQLMGALAMDHGMSPSQYSGGGMNGNGARAAA